MKRRLALGLLLLLPTAAAPAGVQRGAASAQPGEQTVGRYQLHVVPRGWVVFDTHTGAIERWTEEERHFLVIVVRPGESPTRRVVTKP